MPTNVKSDLVVTLHVMNNKKTDTLLGGRSPKLGEPRKSLCFIFHLIFYVCVYCILVKNVAIKLTIGIRVETVG
jgi:hypothetical protein